MGSSKRIVGFLGVAVVAAGAIGVFLHARSQENVPPQNQAVDRRLKQLDDDATPIVELNDADSLDADRRSKNSRHDGRRWIKPSPDPTVFEVVTEPRRVVSDLPADESDLIIEGQTIASVAFLSNDKNNVYSEIGIHVSKVIKAVPNLSVVSGQSITAERLGGRVRYPDGRIIRYRVVGHGSAVTGKNYVFFLSKVGLDTYTILTAYEVTGDKVFALDGSRTNGGVGKSSFDRHNNQDYLSFISEVAQAISQPHAKKQRGIIGP